MGDRLIVMFQGYRTHLFDQIPAVYMHEACDIGKIFAETRALMGPSGCCRYTCARFVGVAHAHIPGNMSLGLDGYPRKALETPALYTHGDMGVWIVDIRTEKWAIEMHATRRSYSPFLREAFPHLPTLYVRKIHWER